MVLCTGGQSYCCGLWIGHHYKEPVLQAAHAVWSLGAAIGPFIIGQFLVELPPKYIANDVINCTSQSSVLDTTTVAHTASTSNCSTFAGILMIHNSFEVAQNCTGSE